MYLAKWVGLWSKPILFYSFYFNKQSINSARKKQSIKKELTEPFPPFQSIIFYLMLSFFYQNKANPNSDSTFLYLYFDLFPFSFWVWQHVPHARCGWIDLDRCELKHGFNQVSMVEGGKFVFPLCLQIVWFSCCWYVDVLFVLAKSHRFVPLNEN